MEKKTRKINIWRILAYFVIYSIMGYLIETAFGLLTKGTLESRKGFLYGPFCPIYGVGAVAMILGLQYFTKNKYTLFFGGFVIGSIIEYVISLVGEIIFKVKWWDYSTNFLNINGRVCFTFSLFWGLLAIYLMSHFNPIIDKLLDKLQEKFSTKILRTVLIIIVVALAIDGILTAVSLKLFFARTVYTYNLDVQNKEKYIEEYDRLLSQEKLLILGNKVFSDKKMLRTFPNLKLEANNRRNNIYARYI